MSNKMPLFERTVDKVVTDNTKVIEGLNKRIAELEKERDELKEENLALQTYVFRSIAFVTRAVEKLKDIPEFKPTGYVLNRVLRMTPKTALQAHNLEQQAKGVEDSVTKLERPDVPLAPSLILNDDLLDYAVDLRNQAKAIKDGE